MHEQVSWVEVRLSEVTAELTALRLEHFAPVPDEHWDRFGPGAGGIGWEYGLLALDRHLATRQRVDASAVEEWALSEEGLSFLRASSDGWCAAAVAAGEDRTTAETRAERCRAFYSGEAVAEE